MAGEIVNFAAANGASRRATVAGEGWIGGQNRRRVEGGAGWGIGEIVHVRWKFNGSKIISLLIGRNIMLCLFSQ